MTIYIYGSDSFKNEINEVLKHSNIKFRLDDNSQIKELSNIDELKNAISDNPNNIYLIDDSKIIKKNILTDKIKFLRPKDGIEQEYLLDHGIGDVSVDSIDELSKHIIRRLDSVVPKEEDIDQIQDSIIEIVEGAYEEDSSINDEKNHEYVELDDELSQLLSSSKDDDTYFEESNTQEEKEELSQEEEFEPSSNLDELLNQLEQSHNSQISPSNEEDKQNEENEQENDIDDDFEQLQSVLDQIEEIPDDDKQDHEEVMDLSFDDNLDNIKNEKSEKSEALINSEDGTQGETMSDQFSEFDTLSEDDILAALSGMENVTVTKDEKSVDEPKVAPSKASSSIDIQNSSSDDIAKLITQLLNNKTLEITIKVKD